MAAELNADFVDFVMRPQCALPGALNVRGGRRPVVPLR